MSHSISSVIFGVAIVVFSSSWAMAATDAPPKTTEAFLQHAATCEQEQIDLGQVAEQKAESEDVKQFGVRMVTDHQKTRKEIERLASKGGLQLVSQSSEKDAAMKSQLDRASGKGFDRAYIALTLQAHALELKELEQRAREEKNQDVRKWAAETVPVVKDHITRAKALASSLGVPDEHIEK
ncbi:MAG: DUF4142 domain-containing protein [Nitrospira sp.]